MNKLNLLLKISLLTLIGLFVFSCEPDEVDAPTIFLVSGTDFVSADATLPAITAFKVKVNGTKGGTAMKTLTVEVDGITISAANISGDIASGVALLPTSDIDQFTYEISIISHGSGTAEYSFIVTDEGGKTDNVKINIEVSPAPLSIAVINGSASIQRDAQGLSAFEFKATRGDAAISKVAVYDGNGNLISKDNLRWNDSGVKFDNNPLDISGNDASGFEKIIYILASRLGNNNFTVEVEDANGEKASVDVIVLVGQDFDTIYSDITIFNADGPNKGSVDLHTGAMVSSSDQSRDLMDGGIDLNLPVDTNWKHTFKSVQGATMVALDGAEFNTIDSREEVESLYFAGTEISETDALNVNDVVIVRADLDDDNEFDYFVINIDQVNNTTGADNEDNFVISYKASLDK